MKYVDLTPRDVAKLIDKLDSAIERAEKGRKKLKELLDKAETIIGNHGSRISQNEEDIQAGKDKLTDHEQRLRNLEGI